MKKILTTALFLCLVSLGAWGTSTLLKIHNSNAENAPEAAGPTNPPLPTERVEEIPVIAGTTYVELMQSAGIGYNEVMAIYDASKNLYDLANVRSGRDMRLVYDAQTDAFKELRYDIDTEETLFVTKQIADDESKIWVAVRKPIPYEIRIKTYHGTVQTSMYQAAMDNGIDERAVIAFADAFQWTIDFASDPRVGDTFDFVVEERYLNGEYVMPGNVLAGRYTNAGTVYEVYYFEETDDNKGYFDTDANSVQKMFLKAPVAFKYISSGFTTGQRYVEAFNVSTGHRAIDYAAVYGSPIRATADGTITFAGWNSGGYGNMVSVRHNGTYSTNYAHMSKIAVKRGQKVKQGEVIGYVGSTGFSTGPHVHYELVKNGVKVNPLKEILPPGQPVKDENRERFEQEKARRDDLLKQ
jgi:murein DD-endopeptidase MepM/ murein hydrolase activator NlpD